MGARSASWTDSASCRGSRCVPSRPPGHEIPLPPSPRSVCVCVSSRCAKQSPCVSTALTEALPKLKSSAVPTA
eukprot:1081936-Pyramimonas_sp.AAC.1